MEFAGNLQTPPISSPSLLLLPLHNRQFKCNDSDNSAGDDYKRGGVVDDDDDDDDEDDGSDDEDVQ